MCKQCGGIFVDAADVREVQLPPLLLPGIREHLRNRPECSGNRDVKCSLCRLHCPVRQGCSRISPPVDSGYFPVHGIGDAAGKQVGTTSYEWADSGDRDLKKMATSEGILRHWSRYFRTLYFIVVSPSRFFVGAFSKQSGSFHAQLGTLNSGRFLAYHLTFLSIISIAIALALPGQTFGNLDWIITIIEFVMPLALTISFHIACMYIPGVLVIFFLRRTTRQVYRCRRVDLTGEPHGSGITMPNVLRAITYTMGIEIPAFIAAELYFHGLTEMINTGANVSLPIAELYGLALAFKLISLLLYLPVSLSYSCRVPWNAAYFAGAWTFMAPLVLVTMLRLLLMFMGVR